MSTERDLGRVEGKLERVIEKLDRIEVIVSRGHVCKHEKTIQRLDRSYWKRVGVTGFLSALAGVLAGMFGGKLG